MDATDGPLSANSDDQVCPICLNSFTEPKIIICGHIMCRECLLAWLIERGRKADCPLCRHPILEIKLSDSPVDVFTKSAVDSLPTDQVMKATARGKSDITLETCPGCEDLLCSSRSSSHPDCPGPQDTHKREADAGQIVKNLSNKLQVMVQLNTEMQEDLKDMEEELRSLEEVSETVDQLQDQALRFVRWLQSQTAVHRSILLTHQHILQRMQDSRQVVATILMGEPLQNRVELIKKKMEHLNQCYLQSFQNLRASWRSSLMDSS